MNSHEKIGFFAECEAERFNLSFFAMRIIFFFLGWISGWREEKQDRVIRRSSSICIQCIGPSWRPFQPVWGELGTSQPTRQCIATAVDRNTEREREREKSWSSPTKDKLSYWKDIIRSAFFTQINRQQANQIVFFPLFFPPLWFGVFVFLPSGVGVARLSGWRGGSVLPRLNEGRVGVCSRAMRSRRHQSVVIDSFFSRFAK